MSRRQERLSERMERNLDRLEKLAETIDDLGLQAIKNPGPASADSLAKAREQLNELARRHESLLEESESLGDEYLKRIETIQEEKKDIFGRSYDLQKHVTTLSAASIVGVAAVVNAFQPGTDLKQTATIGIACLLVAIVTAVFGMLMDTLELAFVGAEKPTVVRLLLGLGWVFRWVSLSVFSGGFVFIGTFAIKSF